MGQCPAFEAVSVQLSAIFTGIMPRGPRSRASRLRRNKLRLGRYFVKRRTAAAKAASKRHAPISGRQHMSAGSMGGTLELDQRQVKEILVGKIVVGHALHNDLKCLGHRVPLGMTRDTQVHYNASRCSESDLQGRGLKTLMRSQTHSLRHLAESVLSRTIQEGCHSELMDAQTTMALYIWDRVRFERCPHPEAQAPSSCKLSYSSIHQLTAILLTGALHWDHGLALEVLLRTNLSVTGGPLCSYMCVCVCVRTYQFSMFCRYGWLVGGVYIHIPYPG